MAFRASLRGLLLAERFARFESEHRAQRKAREAVRQEVVARRNTAPLSSTVDLQRGRKK